MTDFLDIMWLLPVFMYAETHYRFRYFWSFLRKQEPEILADAPHRIEPGNDIPLLVLIKDAHRYPCTLRRLTVNVSRDGLPLSQEILIPKPVKIQDEWWWKVYRISAKGITGLVTLDVTFEVKSGRGLWSYHNDNYRTSSQSPLRVFVADSPLPKTPGLHLGDAHIHSSYTNDQVEYGIPLVPASILSSAMGQSFFCVMDHSYDLDDTVSDYLRNDPALPKWNALKREVHHINRSSHRHKIIGGEEVSCRNSRGENVHFLLFGNDRFIPGSGDSAERWFRTRSEFSVREVLATQDGNSAVAAHPHEHIPFIQKVLLNRGQWTRSDLRVRGLAGTQFLNGCTGEEFYRGRSEWIALLLSGIRSLAYAGNDAHGNFNRFRQIGIPFVRIAEHEGQIFGRMRTGLSLKAGLSERAIFSALQRGSIILSDGPVATFLVINEQGESATIGESISGTDLKVNIAALSSTEFGAIATMKVYCGLFGKNREELIHAEDGVGNIRLERSIRLKVRQRGYLRLEVTTAAHNTYDQIPHFCLTNPIWFDSRITAKEKPFRRRALSG